ncbi:MAG TPA: hypothetical protein VNF91_02750 [Candidatus Acidoferrum sp.]|nr:hypothetical protein [Candidatus Acidoferrum sp.]
MRFGPVLMLPALLAVSCGGVPANASHSVSPSASPSAATAASPSSAPLAVPLRGSYGLLLSAGTLQLVSPDATVAASVTVAPASAQFCSYQNDTLVAPPPVSASSDEVYFRDGDTRIRMIASSSGAEDVTTVPGGPTTISFFSVSPDDQRIAVLVEEVSNATAVNERLYVEDLRGGGNHVDIFKTDVPKDVRGTTLWPMGWHQGQLVMAVMAACTSQPVDLSPSAWKVVDATSFAQKVDIVASSCILSVWPSPAGVVCVNLTQPNATAYDWTDKALGAVTTDPLNRQSGLDPSGQSVFLSSAASAASASQGTGIHGRFRLGNTEYGLVAGHSACLWIDSSHLLAPDSVIRTGVDPSDGLTFGQVTLLSANGQCAGRFPGGL